MEHHFNVEIAQEYGVNAAILLSNLQFWIKKNEVNGENFFNGTYWTYNSVKAFSELFSYLSEKQIRTALKKLSDEGIIIEGNFNGSKLNRTLWYAITEKGYALLQKSQFDFTKRENVDLTKSTSAFALEGKCINTDNKLQIINTDIYSAADKPLAQKSTKHKHGEYNNVLLTGEEFEKLKAEIPNVNEYIERLSSYIASKGTKYKSHYATIRNWYRKDEAERPKPATDEPGAYDIDYEQLKKEGLNW